MMKKINDICFFGVNIFYYICLFFILANVFIVSAFFDYYSKKEYILINLILLFLFIVFICIKRIFKFKINIDISKKTLFIITGILFIFQIIIFYYSYFITGWDSNQVTQYAYNLVNNNSELLSGWNSYYYSLYPNNFLITIIYSIIFKINFFIGIKSFALNVFSLIIFQSFLSFVTSLIVYNCIYDYSNSKKTSFYGWLLCILLVCFSPWIMIPYSDALSVIIPVLIFRLLQKYLNKRRNDFIVLISILSFIALKIKPQCFIISIAIVLCMLFSMKIKSNYKSILVKSCCFIVPFLLLFISFDCCSKHILKLEIGNNNSITYNHYIMMGLNDKTDGSYYDDDVQASFKYSNSKDRKKFNNKVIKSRICNYGFLGIVKHISKKTMLIYNDGTFAWGAEGEFYKEILHKDNLISNFFRNVYYNDGVYSKYYYIYLHTIWILVLCCLIMSFKYSKDILHLILKLSFVGVFVFELLFEARARYLFCILPLFIILVCFSINQFDNLPKEEKNEK